MLFKSIASAAALVLAALSVAPAAQAGCGHPHGGGYSSYQPRQSSGYAARLRAERKAAARAAAERRIAAAKAEKARVAKAEAAAEKKDQFKTASATPEPAAEPAADTAKTETGSIAKDEAADEAKTESKPEAKVASAKPTCSKFVAAVGATITVACDKK